MCRNLILLARNDQQQMIFTCEHGTIHVTHQQITICMVYPIFLQFAALVVKGDWFTLNESSFGHIQEGENQQIDLWIDSGGLRLTVTEFVALSDLLGLALQQLSRLRAAQPSVTLQSVGLKRKYPLN